MFTNHVVRAFLKKQKELREENSRRVNDDKPHMGLISRETGNKMRRSESPRHDADTTGESEERVRKYVLKDVTSTFLGDMPTQHHSKDNPAYTPVLHRKEDPVYRGKRKVKADEEIASAESSKEPVSSEWAKPSDEQSVAQTTGEAKDAANLHDKNFGKKKQREKVKELMHERIQKLNDTPDYIVMLHEVLESREFVLRVGPQDTVPQKNRVAAFKRWSDKEVKPEVVDRLSRMYGKDIKRVAGVLTPNEMEDAGVIVKETVFDTGKDAYRGGGRLIGPLSSEGAHNIGFEKTKDAMYGLQNSLTKGARKGTFDKALAGVDDSAKGIVSNYATERKARAKSILPDEEWKLDKEQKETPREAAKKEVAVATDAEKMRKASAAMRGVDEPAAEYYNQMANKIDEGKSVGTAAKEVGPWNVPGTQKIPTGDLPAPTKNPSVRLPAPVAEIPVDVARDAHMGRLLKGGMATVGGLTAAGAILHFINKQREKKAREEGRRKN